MRTFFRNKNFGRRIVISRIKRRIFKHILLMRFLLTSLFLLIFCFVLILGYRTLNSSGVGRDLSLIYDFVFTPTAITKSIDGRTNILILGKSNSDYENSGLTDAIFFISIPNEKSKIVTIMLPKNIWIDDLKAQLDSVYNLGNQRESGGGTILAKSVIEEVTGQPIQYVAVVNFNGIKKVIDELGDVNVNVKTGFTDSRYPIPGRQNDSCGGDPELKCRFETITFKAGLQKMDGDVALKFIQSRHADNNVDFAQDVRLEELIVAIKDKISSENIFLRPARLVRLLKTTNDYIETDLSRDGMAVLAGRVFRFRNNFSSNVLSNNFLVNSSQEPKHDNLSVFVSKSGNWDDVHLWVECLLAGRVCN